MLTEFAKKKFDFNEDTILGPKFSQSNYTYLSLAGDQGPRRSNEGADCLRFLAAEGISALHRFLGLLVNGRVLCTAPSRPGSCCISILYHPAQI